MTVATATKSTAGAPARGWPEAVAAQYRESGLWAGETLDGLLRVRASEHAERTALVGGEARRTYAELNARATALAHAFLADGIAPGDRVVVWVPNQVGFVEVLFGLWRTGALPVFALPAHRRHEIEAFCAQASASAIVTVERHGGFAHAEVAEAVADAVDSVRRVYRLEGLDALVAGTESAKDDVPPALPTVDPGSVAFLQLSGGTTGTPKLIPRTHDDYLCSVRRSAELCGLTPESVLLVVLPAAHNFPMSSPGILGALHAGATTVLAPSGEPHGAFGLIAREGVTLVSLVPPLALAWHDALVALPGEARPDLSSLAVLQVGGARLGDDLAARIEPAFDCTLQQVFGMAEGLVCYTRLDDPVALRTGTQGRPMHAEDEVRIVDDAGAEVPEGAVGHLQTRGPYTIRGYSADADPGAFTADGFYCTGDLVRREPTGHLVVTGRAKEQINRGGEKIAPDEVEEHLRAHPAVVDAAVVAEADARLGERSCAVVVARGDAPAAGALRRFLRERGVAAYKVPDRVVVVDAFPHTGVGKVSRRALRAAVSASLAATETASAAATPACAPARTPDSEVRP